MTAGARAVMAGSALAAAMLFAGGGPAAAGPPAAGSVAVAVHVADAARAAGGEVIGGVDVDEAVAALGDDHVAVLGRSASGTGLAEAVSQARDAGLALSVLVVDNALTSQQAMEIAGVVQVRTSGTVLVLAPDADGSHSAVLSTGAEEGALAAALAAGDPVAAVRAYTATATEKPFPWSMIVIAAVIAALAAGWIGKIRGRRRRERQDLAALADLTNGLADRIEDLTPKVASLPSRVSLTGREDIEFRLDQARIGHRTLQDRLSVPLGSRKEVDIAASEVNTLDAGLRDIEREVDNELGSRRPPG